MATILEFRAESTRAGDTRERAPRTGPGEVVIFPGVRYERWDEPPARPRSRRSRLRDRLELED